MRAALLGLALLAVAAAQARAGMALSLLRPPPGLLRLDLMLIGGPGARCPCVR